jgi:hypothetical protein
MAPTSTFDPVRYREAARAEWGDAAAGWRAWAGVLEADGAGLAVSRKLVELAGIGPGSSVLDVAAGYGEPGLTAARAAGPNGHVVCTDLSARCWPSAASGPQPPVSPTSSLSRPAPTNWPSPRPASTPC